MPSPTEHFPDLTLPTPGIARTLPISGPPFARPDAATIERLHAVSSATASALLHRMGVRRAFIQGPIPRRPGARVVGPAVTLQFMPQRTVGFTPNYASQAGLFPWANNVPIACGGVLVLPGDIIIADDDGAVMIPRQMADLLIEHGGAHEDWEVFSHLKLAEVGSLKLYNPLDKERRAELRGRVQDAIVSHRFRYNLHGTV